ncbi:MAG TPA: hypothetical protein VG937_00015 [Polyangiaceae bacterium]|nr:hypothetical protein [Polyangiaceae bacterium]
MHRDHARPAVAALLGVVALERLVVVLGRAKERAERPAVADPVAPTPSTDLALAHARVERDPNKGAPRNVDLLGEQCRDLGPGVRRSRLAPSLQRLARQHARIAGDDLVELSIPEHRANRAENVRDALLDERAFGHLFFDAGLRTQLLHELNEVQRSRVLHFQLVEPLDR